MVDILAFTRGLGGDGVFGVDEICDHKAVLTRNGRTRYNFLVKWTDYTFEPDVSG